MPLVSNTLNFTSKVLTFGGSTKVKSAKQEYDHLYNQYAPIFEELKSIEAETECVLKQIGYRLKKTNDLLRRVENELNRNLSIDNQVNIVSSSKTIKDINDFSSSYNTAANAGFGGIVGGSSAVGAWALVSTMGSASTGASIAGLSGVAASNATLAWFGGGSLAVGGAGMAGGMAVISGIAIVPIFYFAAKGAYNKASRILEETEKLKSNIIKLQEILPLAQTELNKATKCSIYINEITSRYDIVATEILSAIEKNDLLMRKWYKPRTWFSNKYDANTRGKLTEVLALETEHFLYQIHQQQNL
ncbi:hypothetical protein [Vibrio neonatus]|uniref:hypothetical protein n=1 Tax=Vibrio neonatus TaxID=278860 RepID=UPI0021C27E4E|nr:hypothetical protein [Vibrio neonatus]